MSLNPQTSYPIPEDMQRVAQAAFPKGNLYMRMRDELEEIYQDASFAELFPGRGQRAQSPGRLAWVTVMQTLGRLIRPAGSGSSAGTD